MTIQVAITPSGEVVLPTDVRRRLGVEAGGTLLIDEAPEGVVVRGAAEPEDKARKTAEAIRRAQEFARKWPVGSVDDFLAERKAMWGED